MKLIIHGATGRMGTFLCRLAGEDLAAAVSPSAPAGGIPKAYAALTDYTGPADCLIDFSNHTAIDSVLDYCLSRRLPAVIATTGHTPEEKARLQAAAQVIPLFYSANMSVGVAVLADLARRAAAMFPQAEIEIVETHHDQKLDVPSGTALMLAGAMQAVRPEAEPVIGRHENGKRTPGEIGIHSLRLGNVVGIHEILISTGTETITLKHQAESRQLFAQGALRAAEFVARQPAGLYGMQELLETR